MRHVPPQVLCSAVRDGATEVEMLLRGLRGGEVHGMPPLEVHHDLAGKPGAALRMDDDHDEGDDTERHGGDESESGELHQKHEHRAGPGPDDPRQEASAEDGPSDAPGSEREQTDAAALRDGGRVRWPLSHRSPQRRSSTRRAP
jgi:hypothetical protein